MAFVRKSLNRNLASKRKDSNRATSPRHLLAVRSNRYVSSAVESCDHVTVIVSGWSRAMVVPDLDRSRVPDSSVSLFLIPGKKRLRGFAITSQRIWLLDSSVGLFF